MEASNPEGKLTFAAMSEDQRRRYEYCKKIVGVYLDDYNNHRLNFKEPQKKDKLGQMTMLKLHATTSIYFLVAKDEDTEIRFTNTIFRELLIAKNLNLIERKTEGNERITQLEGEVKSLKKDVNHLTKAKSSNERLLFKMALEMLDVRNGLKPNAFQD